MDFRKSFLVINGPNLNLLGTREPDIYGVETYADLENYVNGVADDMNISVEIYQSNHEGEIVDKIQEAAEMYDGIVINPAGYGYTSVAILDALKAVALPCCEVHLTNIEEREEFRRKTLTGSMAVKVISGMGFEGYRLALETLNG
ncbi:MAG: type II 3-dehydroquinate dehydratase [Peptostreptococcaceae bacterium]|nr:type II 3-dehydroquinate dehydratase [Peptostreptococcaceae bacterium]